MSLLLDALKKAAEDKKSKNTDAAVSNASGDELDLELQVDSTVEDSLPEEPSGPAAVHAEPAVQEVPPEDQLIVQAAAVEQVDAEAMPEQEIELEMSIDQIIANDRSQQDKEVLSYLIHKSNQLSARKKRRSRIIYGVLAGMILLVLGIFSYLKLLAVSDQLYTGEPAPSPQPPLTAPSRPPAAKLTVQPDATRAEQKPVRPAPAKTERSVASKAAVSAPVSRQRSQQIPAKPAKSEPIKIIHKKVEDPSDTYLREAYRLFNAGQYDKARPLYAKVLEREARNRDALLGVAAIDMKQAHYASARQNYLLLLRLNPRDSVARAGLSALASEVNQSLDESQLKLMLREQPEAAHLYFALGNIYAADNRWGEAQSAFFSAWSADRQNADYAFNLAVSLDHLGKAKQAIDFYLKSLALIDQTSTDVSAATIQTRIDFLKAQHE